MSLAAEALTATAREPEAPPRLGVAISIRTKIKCTEAAPREATVCVYATHTLYQFPKDALRKVFFGMRDAAADRPIYFVGCEGTGDRCSELKLTSYDGSARTTEHLANANPHGRWLQGLGNPKAH